MIIVKKDFLAERICTEFLLIMGLVGDYVGHNRAWKSILLLLTVVLIVKKRKYRDELTEVFIKSIPFWLALMIGIFSIAFSINNQYLFSNIKKWFTVAWIVFFIDMLNSNEELEFGSVLQSHFFILNFFWIANLIVLAIQCTGNGFMIKEEWLISNSFYIDQCAGLFGNSGTHRLSFFSIFMMVYNLWIAQETSGRIKRIIIYVFTLGTQIWMLYLSIFNDNKTLFALTPIFLFLFYFFQASGGRKRIKDFLMKAIRFFRILIPVGVCIAVFFIYFPEAFEFVEEKVIQSALRLVSQGSTGSAGSIERLTIATDALKGGYGLLFGDGLGAADLSESISGHYRGYQHFSMSSVGSLVTLGGIWLYLSVCLFYTSVFVKFQNHKGKMWMNWMLCLGVLVGMTIYTMIFENMTSMLWLCLTFVIYGKGRGDKKGQRSIVANGLPQEEKEGI